VIQNLVLGALNHLLGQASWARGQLSAFAGRRARFDMPPWQLAFAITADGLFEATTEDEVDVAVSLPADTPLVALQGIDRAMAAAHVTGNAEFATALSFVLKNLRWDAEEDLSKLVGDVVAHRLAAVPPRLTLWRQEALRNAGDNLAEYLGEEARLLVPKHELAGFAKEATEFDTRIAALATRAAKLA
jgi:ubiquinone biosynthesis accessory factor UbiJ